MHRIAVARHARRVEWIAHRSGNSARRAASAVGRADAIELDVHTFRRRLEVRHARVLWPFARQFEPWYLLPADTPRPSVADVLDAIPNDVPVWYDLKGFTPRLARDVLTANGDRRPVTLSCRSWWVLRPGRDRRGVRTMKSVNNRWQRWVVLRTPVARSDSGVVINERLLTPGLLARLSERTAVIVAWGVSDAERARALIDEGIDGLIVDDLGLVPRAGEPSQSGGREVGDVSA